MNKMQMQVVINRHELKIKERERNMCIYAREEMGEIDFDNDKGVLKYFKDFAASHDNK